MDYERINSWRVKLLGFEHDIIHFAYVEPDLEFWRVVFRMDRRLKPHEFPNAEDRVGGYLSSVGLTVDEFSCSQMLITCLCVERSQPSECCNESVSTGLTETTGEGAHVDEPDCDGVYSDVHSDGHCGHIELKYSARCVSVRGHHITFESGGIITPTKQPRPFDLTPSAAILLHSSPLSLPVLTHDLYQVHKLQNRDLFHACRLLLAISPFPNVFWRGVSRVDLLQVLFKHGYPDDLNQLKYYYFKYLYSHGVSACEVQADLEALLRTRSSIL